MARDHNQGSAAGLRDWLPRRKNKQLLPDKDISQIVYNDVCWGADFRKQYEEKWLRFYKLYKNYVNPAEYPFEANVAIPQAFVILAVQKAFLLDMIMDASSFLGVLGKTPEGQAQAKGVHDLLDYHFRNSFRTYEDMVLFLDQLLMYGTSIYKVFWKYEPGWKTRSQVVYDNEGNPDGYERVLSPEIIHNKPFGYTVDLFNFGIDPNADCLDNARFAYEDMWLDPIKLRELQQLDIGFRNIDEALRLATNTNRGLVDRFNELNLTHYQTPPEYTYDGRGKVHIVDYWGYLVKGWDHGKLSPSAKQQLYHAMVALPGDNNVGGGAYNDPVVIFAEPSPFYHNKIPYIDARINASVGEFYGVGDIEYCESLLCEQRDLRNIQLDNMNMSMNRMMKVRRSAGIDDNELVSRPGGVVHVNEIDDVVPLDFSPITPEAFNVQAEIRRDLEAVTGVNDFTMGHYRSSTGFNDTATGVSLIQQVALMRIGQKGQVVQRAIRDIGQMTFSLVGQFEPWGTMVRIVDRTAATQVRFIDVSPDALAHNYDFQVISAPALGSKQIRVQELIQLFQFLIQAKQIDPNFDFDLNRFVLRLIDEMNVPNAQEFFGFNQFGASLPSLLAEPSQEEMEMIPPEQENNVMMNDLRFIPPKLEEHHVQHKVIHMEAHDQLPMSHPGRPIIQKHYQEHTRLEQQSKEIMAQQLAAESAMQGVQAGGEMLMQNESQNQMNPAAMQGNARRGGSPKGGQKNPKQGTKSSGGAAGMEGMLRGLGNMMG